MVKQTVKRRKLTLKAAALTAGAVVIIAGSAAVVQRTVPKGEKVVSVIDGDSFKIANDQTIRLASLDAPGTEYCFGKESAAALNKKILGKKVIISDIKTDRYGRVMAMVYVNGISVNEYMIKNGFALHLWDTSTLKKELSAANDFARENRLGIFSPECYQTEPPNPKCAIKGSIIQTTKKKEYTMPTCDRYALTVIEKYKGEDWFCSEAEAKKAGFVKSPNCK